MIKLLFNYPLPPFLFLCNLLFPPPHPHLMGSLGDTPDAENPFTKQQIQLSVGQTNRPSEHYLTKASSYIWRINRHHIQNINQQQIAGVLLSVG